MSDTTEKHTVSMYFVNAAVARLAPAARARALAEARIAPALLAAPHARVPAPAYSALWLAVARELDDEFFGLDRRAMKVGSFALLCQATVGCPRLESALKRMLRGLAVFLDDVRAELVVGHQATVRLHNGITAEADRRFADETMLVLVHGLMCWLVGRRIGLTQVHFAHARPVYAREYALMFCDQVEFDAAHTTMSFERRALAAEVVQTPASLRAFLRTAPQSVFLKYRNEDSWTGQIRARLRTLAGAGDSWPVFEHLARELGTTATTLRRRLEAEGSSYQTIKDQLRNDMAIDDLCGTRLSVDDIGARLGFQDVSAFHRAFKRWNGVQPGEYRRRRLGATG